MYFCGFPLEKCLCLEDIMISGHADGMILIEGRWWELSEYALRTVNLIAIVSKQMSNVWDSCHEQLEPPRILQQKGCRNTRLSFCKTRDAAHPLNIFAWARMQGFLSRITDFVFQYMT